MQRRTLDPFEIEALWSRLVAIADEAGNALVRTSFSPIVRESKDFACVLMDTAGNSLAQNTVTVPSFCGTMPRTMRHFLQKYPLEQWKPGDVVLTNDPWLGTGHHPDITIAVPVYYKDRIVAFAGAVAHMPDMGGPLSFSGSKELYEEGLNLPICKLYDAGRPNEMLMDILRGNIRVPELTIGDIHAEIASANVMGRRLTEMMEEYHLDELDGVGSHIHSYSESAMRQAIAAIPDGEYSSSVHTDGFEGAPLTLKLKITVSGQDILFDYAGTSPQMPLSVNAVYNCTFTHSAYSFKCAVNPDLPNNEGAFRPLRISAPVGSILNCTRPAAVNSRHLTLHYMHAVIFRALGQAIPEKVIAECGAPSNRTIFAGTRDDGTEFSMLTFTSGGMGARWRKDGLSCTTFPTNSGASSIEVLESSIPILVTQKELRPNSCGAGRFRGGLGQVIHYELLADQPMTLSFFSERISNGPRGLAGGGTGETAFLRLLNRDLDLPPKGKISLRKGDVIEVGCAGGGGVGRPQERDRALVAWDLKQGYITPDWARKHYDYDEQSV